MSTVAAVIRMRHPDVSERNMRRIQKQSSDEALRLIQKDFLPRHFLRSAVSRYPDAYGMIREKLRKDPRKQPLVKTGLVRNLVLNGTPSFTGAGNRRKMILRGLPRYFYQTRNYQPGRFHKQSALEEMTDDERDAVIRAADKSISELINQSR